MGAIVLLGVLFAGAMAWGQNDLPLTEKSAMNMISPLDPARDAGTPDVTQAAYAEQDRIDRDVDELMGPSIGSTMQNATSGPGPVIQADHPPA